MTAETPHALAAALTDAVEGTEAADLRIEIPRSDTAPVGLLLPRIRDALEPAEELPEVSWIGDGDRAADRDGVPKWTPTGTLTVVPGSTPDSTTPTWVDSFRRHMVEAWRHRDEAGGRTHLFRAEEIWGHLFAEEMERALTWVRDDEEQAAYEWWCGRVGLWPRPAGHSLEEGKRWSAQFTRPEAEEG